MLRCKLTNERLSLAIYVAAYLAQNSTLLSKAPRKFKFNLNFKHTNNRSTNKGELKIKKGR
jgi:hypothetical protein